MDLECHYAMLIQFSFDLKCPSSHSLSLAETQSSINHPLPKMSQSSIFRPPLFFVYTLFFLVYLVFFPYLKYHLTLMPPKCQPPPQNFSLISIYFPPSLVKVRLYNAALNCLSFHTKSVSYH